MIQRAGGGEKRSVFRRQLGDGEEHQLLTQASSLFKDALAHGTKGQHGVRLPQHLR